MTKSQLTAGIFWLIIDTRKKCMKKEKKSLASSGIRTYDLQIRPTKKNNVGKYSKSFRPLQYLTFVIKCCDIIYQFLFHHVQLHGRQPQRIFIVPVVYRIYNMKPKTSHAFLQKWFLSRTPKIKLRQLLAGPQTNDSP